MPKEAKIGGGYLTIENKGPAADRGSTDIAGGVSVPEMSMDKGVMKMRALENGPTIEPGKTVKLTPGGNHLMMVDLKSPLKKGDNRLADFVMEEWMGRSLLALALGI